LAEHRAGGGNWGLFVFTGTFLMILAIMGDGGGIFNGIWWRFSLYDVRIAVSGCGVGRYGFGVLQPITT